MNSPFARPNDSMLDLIAIADYLHAPLDIMNCAADLNRDYDGARYPDYNSSLEVFSNNRMLELETLAPLVTLQPGAVVSHEERWELHKDIELGFSEDDVRKIVEPLAYPKR